MMLKTAKYEYVLLLLNLYSNFLPSTTCTKIVTVNEGEEASFECSAETTQVWWNRYELYCPEIIPSSMDLITNDSRFFLNNSTWPYFNLTIGDIQHSDEGMYRCMSISPPYLIIAEYLLLVRNEPSDDKKVIKEHGSVELRCSAENAETEMEVIWVRKNRETFPSGERYHVGNELKFNNVSRFDAGTYRCSGLVIFKEIDLAVKYAPIIHNLSVITEFAKVCPIEEVYPEPRIELAVFDIAFECLVEAYPEPEVFWYKDNTRLINNMNFRIERRKVNATVWKSTLRMIESNQEVNKGVYKCVARNKVATVSREVPKIFHLVLETQTRPFAR
ncbi:lachesin-like [Planococcus citri]|uniref:lachesin-like n=1 Tax=Planococcus citri TaxID=170843 RepID=UPI0031F9800F